MKSWLSKDYVPMLLVTLLLVALVVAAGVGSISESDRGEEMKCMQPGVRLPVDFHGEIVNVQIDPIQKKMWVCVDGQAVLRVRVTIDVQYNGESVKPEFPEDE